jgi:hypothetical protein
MAYLIAFHWAWLLASLLLGLGMGWIAVVTRARPVSKRWLAVISVLAAVLVALALTRTIPGRFGYWLDLFLIMFVPYLVGCAIGSLLRSWVVMRSAGSQISPSP